MIETDDATAMRQFRERHGLSPTAAAEALGIRQSSIWNHEHGQRGISAPLRILMELINQRPELLPLVRGLANRLKR